MTLENLIRIVVEVVEKVILQERVDILAIGFHSQNTQNLIKASSEINSNGHLIQWSEHCTLPSVLPDVLFLDYIPLRYVPDVALGVRNDPFTKLIADMILSGKRIVCLGYEPMGERTPEAYKALFNNYYKMIASYSVVFETFSCKQKAVYSGNVLSKKELLAYAEAGEITVAQSVVITALAQEEAEKANIKISRMML